MANKIKLGARPKTFKKTVTFDMLDGTKGAIVCEYKYRTRKEFGEFIDGILEAAKLTMKDVSAAEDGADQADRFSMAAQMAQTAGASADYILQVLEGWNLDEPLTRESIEQLDDEIPAATQAIMEAYRAACAEGRLGN